MALAGQKSIQLPAHPDRQDTSPASKVCRNKARLQPRFGGQLRRIFHVDDVAASQFVQQPGNVSQGDPPHFWEQGGEARGTPFVGHLHPAPIGPDPDQEQPIKAQKRTHLR